MPENSAPTILRDAPSGRWWLFPALLGAVLAILFAKSFEPHAVLFSNDGPLGLMSSDENQLPGRFAGTWRPLGWIGAQGPAASVTMTTLIGTLTNPVMFLKLYAPLTVLFLGFSAWVFFRQLRFSQMTSVIGGLAAALNMHFFSIACWGQGSWELCAGMFFLGLAALSSQSIKYLWARAVLAGLAIGLGVMEGFDTGAILSVFFGAFVAFSALIAGGSLGKRIAAAFFAESVVVFFAAFVAVQTISTLVMTQVTGISGTSQDEQTKENRWLPDTRWSLPKLETIEIFVPGVFGYRTSQHIEDRDRSSGYWGKIGEDPKVPQIESGDFNTRTKALDELNAPDDVRKAVLEGDAQSRAASVEQVLLRSGASRRFTGSGEYAGVLTALLALLAIANSFRRDGSALARNEKLLIWFWAVVALFALSASWGKFSFVYAILYRIPYVSTIRNPVKFMHPFQIAWVILAAYGLECLYRQRMKAGTKRSETLLSHVQRWWIKASGFDKHCAVALVALVGAAAAGWFFFNSWRPNLVRYLEHSGFSLVQAPQIATFSSLEVLWFVILLALSAAVIIGILSGAWSGPASKWAGIYLGVILVFDLARADAHWIHYVDYKVKLADNPVTEFLSDKPYEQRVIGRLEPFGPGSGMTPGGGQLYYVWLQHDFPYHNIQALDFAQMPRVPTLDRAYAKALALHGTEVQDADLFPAVRFWQLTNTRYLFGPWQTCGLLNERVPEINHAAKIIARLQIEPKTDADWVVDYSDYTVATSDSGAYALIEAPNVLPRAKLYSNWQVPTNDDEALRLLPSREFDPQQTVLVSADSSFAQASSRSTADPGTVNITDYRPKRIHMSADVKTPAVLLLNDRYDASWRVSVDGQRAPLLRCNYIMRGVYLTPGHHEIEFRFKISLKGLYLNLCALCIGLCVSGFLIATRPREIKIVSALAPPPSPSPQPPPAQGAAPKPVRSKAPGKQKARR